MKVDLRLTDTNAASDSAGKTWGLDGNLFWWVVAGLGAGIGVFFLMVVVFKAGLFVSFGVAALPVLVCLAYILLLRQGKPPGYDHDMFERLFGDNGLRPELSAPKHPLHET